MQPWLHLNLEFNGRSFKSIFYDSYRKILSLTLAKTPHQYFIIQSQIHDNAQQASSNFMLLNTLRLCSWLSRLERHKFEPPSIKLLLPLQTI